MLFGGNLSSVNPSECVSINNEECKVRPEMLMLIVTSLYFILLVLKQVNEVVIWNNVNDSYAKFCVPDVVKNINIKVFNLMSRTNKIRHIKWLKTCKCKCRLDLSVCNSKQRWNKDTCRCESKGIIDKGICDKRFIWNPSNCECECDKSCDVGEYLNYENCKCRKKLIDKLIEDYTENTDEVKIAEIALFECIN